MMAALPDSSTFTLEDKISLRNWCFHKYIVKNVLKFTFENDTKDRPHHKPLLEYYKDKGFNRFERNLCRQQESLISNDPTGATFDTSLLYKCLRYGSTVLAKGNDNKWTAEDIKSMEDSIEANIKFLKDRRNIVAHESNPISDSSQLSDEAQLLKDSSIRIIKFCGQIYSLPDTETIPMIAEVQTNIEKYLKDDIETYTEEEYKKGLLFEAHLKKINTEGVKNLEEQYGKLCEDRVNTVNHLVDVNLPIEKLYTEMKLKGHSASGKEDSIPFEEVLLDSSRRKTNDIVVMSGVAGVGKTTFTKKMLYDWRFRLSDMKHLTEHNILLKTECRNTVIKSFDDLLHHLMPRVSKELEVNDLKKVVLAQNILVLVDGLDELNENSAKLFNEILYLKTLHKISLIITTRPEKMKYLEQSAKYHHLTIKHIEITGVPMEKRAELVTRYYNEIARNRPETRGIGQLLAYLKQTMYRLEDLWRLPYNLTLITLLFVYDYMEADSINTAPELYREILKLCSTKLMERLRSGKTTSNLSESTLKRKVHIFMNHLAKESLIGLKDNNINLPQEAYERLEEVCRYINIPVEELTSAFLKRIPGDEDIYSFPHKGLQDYLAAWYIWMEITKKSETIDTMKLTDDLRVTFVQHDTDFNAVQNILRFTKKELEALHSGEPSTIQSLIQDIHESKEYDVSKYRNVLVNLIGLFHLESDTVLEKTKLEALDLLQISGVESREDWITVLNSVKCDDFVASYINKKDNFLNLQYVVITDSSASAYVSLMQALNPASLGKYGATFEIDIRGDLDDSSRKLLRLTRCHLNTFTKFIVNEKNLKSYLEVIEELPVSCIGSKLIANVNIDGDFFDAMKIGQLIVEKGINVSAVEARDIEINDSNFQDIISQWLSLPKRPMDYNCTKIIIRNDRDLFDIEKLREMIMNYRFECIRFLVSENNYENHLQKFNGITNPNVRSFTIDIDIDRDILDLADFLDYVRTSDLYVDRFKVRDLYLDDDNAEKYCGALRMLPERCLRVNATVVHMWFNDKWRWSEIIAQLDNLRIKSRISITYGNVEYIIGVLSLPYTPLIYDEMVVVDINGISDLLKLSRLLILVRKRKFQIANLEMKLDTMEIGDDNANAYYAALKSLTKSVNSTYKVSINVVLDFVKEFPLIGKVLHKISTYQSTATIRLWYGFKEPRRYLTSSIFRGIQMALERCRVEEYAGFIAPKLKIPSSVVTLWAGIHDTDSYMKLKDFLASDNHPHLAELNINMSLNVNIEDIDPLVGDLKNPTSLSFPSILLGSRRDTHIETASEIAKRLAPVSGEWKGKFRYLRLFSTPIVDPEGIIKFLKNLEGLTVLDGIYIPASARPHSNDDTSIMEDLAKMLLGCDTGITWEE